MKLLSGLQGDRDLAWVSPEVSTVYVISRSKMYPGEFPITLLVLSKRVPFFLMCFHFHVANDSVNVDSPPYTYSQFYGSSLPL